VSSFICSRIAARRSEVLSPAEVIQSATVINARLLGREGELGVIQAGALADMIAIDGNPLRDLGVLQDQGAHVSMVMKGGDLFKNVTASKPARIAVPVS